MHRSWIALAVVAAVAAAGAAHAADDRSDAAVRIALNPLVHVTGAEVKLGEVAALTTDSLPLLTKLVALPLGAAPRAGEPVRLTRAELARWIEARTGLRGEQLRWSGPMAAEILRATHEISGERLAAAAREQLRGWLASRSTRAEIQEIAVPRDMTLPDGTLAVDVRPIPADQPMGRRMTIWVDLSVDGRFVRTVPVGFEVAAYGPAYVATQDVASGTPIEAARLELREVPLGGRTAKAFAPNEAKTQFVRPVAAGQVVAARDVHARPAVARGDWVALRVHADHMDVESKAEVLQNGAVGQLVSVKPRGATGTLEARVLGPGQVEVVE